ncbi:hypothetical protein ASE05_27045 [Mesorhizobium sp. Root172]|nr:hypothetical protein ASE05_27045 [Mesorhizobium sp. Root172]
MKAGRWRKGGAVQGCEMLALPLIALPGISTLMVTGKKMQPAPLSQIVDVAIGALRSPQLPSARSRAEGAGRQMRGRADGSN